MGLTTADEVYEEVVKPLPEAERRRLMAKIERDLVARPSEGETRQRRSWSEIRGVVDYPLVEEDAQAWITRTRRESDEQRERQWVRER